MAELSYAQVSAMLKYDSETGKLFWLERPKDMFPDPVRANSWNKRYAGKEAFTSLNSVGYRHGSIFKIGYLAHRIIWLLHTGRWPDHQIDHINGNRSDNRPSNLRDVSSSENQRNVKLSTRNTSGVCGVHWNKQTNRWQALIKVSGKKQHLGFFDNIEFAAAARAEAEQKYGYSRRHGR